MHVVLVGPMGVGKTTVGAGLAARLGRRLRDSDADLQASRHIRGRELAARDGVDALHRWEARHLLDALAAPEPAVIAAAASVVDDPHCRRALAAPFVVWLRAPARALAARMSPSDHRRPLAAPGTTGDAGRALAALEGLEAERAPRFAAVADLAVDGAGVGPDDVVLTIIEGLPTDLQRIGGHPDLPGAGGQRGLRSRGRTTGQ
jgi:shikimate kinase